MQRLPSSAVILAYGRQALAIDCHIPFLLANLALMAQISVPTHAAAQVGFVASFASKLSDTVSSEIGKVCH